MIYGKEIVGCVIGTIGGALFALGGLLLFNFADLWIGFVLGMVGGSITRKVVYRHFGF